MRDRSALYWIVVVIVACLAFFLLLKAIDVFDDEAEATHYGGGTPTHMSDWTAWGEFVKIPHVSGGNSAFYPYERSAQHFWCWNGLNKSGSNNCGGGPFTTGSDGQWGGGNPGSRGADLPFWCNLNGPAGALGIRYDYRPMGIYNSIAYVDGFGYHHFGTPGEYCTIHINSEAWLTLNREQRCGAFTHEVGHLLGFTHNDRPNGSNIMQWGATPQVCRDDF